MTVALCDRQPGVSPMRRARVNQAVIAAAQRYNDRGQYSWERIVGGLCAQFGWDQSLGETVLDNYIEMGELPW